MFFHPVLGEPWDYQNACYARCSFCSCRIEMTPSSPDPVLREFLEAQDDACADAALSDLIFPETDALIRRIAGYRLGADIGEQDRDDIVSDVIVLLVERLQALRADDDASPIQSFHAHASVAAHNGCDAFLRRRYPQRHRLRNRLRYAIDRSAKFLLWDSGGTFVCGTRGTEGRRAGVAASDFAARMRVVPADDPEAGIAEVLRLHGGPIEFESMVGILANLWGVVDHQSGMEQAQQTAVAPLADADLVIDQRRSLQRLWTEVLELPVQQRLALLLNLRDSEGGSAISTLPATGTASIRAVAAALEMAAEELAQLWGRLPLSDLEIAALMNTSRHQVINLRKSARERLTRRAKAAGGILR